MGALRRAAPIPSARPFSKRSREAAPAACGAVARESTAHLVGAERKLSAAPRSKYVKANRSGIIVEMEVIPVGGGEVPNARPFMKRPQIVETAARRAGAEEQLSVPCPKRTKVTRNSVVERSSDEPALGKRMAAELDALHALVRKAEMFQFKSAAEPRSEAPVEAYIKTAPAKMGKAYIKAGESSNGQSSSSDSGSSSSSDSVQPAPEPASVVAAAQSTKPELFSMATLIAKANDRRELLEMERAVLPDESIHPSDLKNFCIAEYGRPGIMRHLGLFLKTDA